MKKTNWIFIASCILIGYINCFSAQAADRETDFNTHDGSPGANEPQDPPPEDPTNCGGNSTGSPVFLANRQLFWSDVDIALPGRPALGLVRTYKSNDSREGIFGKGWTASCERRLVKTYDVSSEKLPVGELGAEEIVNSTALIYIYRAADGRTYSFLQNTDKNGFVAPDGLKGDLRLEEIATGAALINLDGSREEFDGRGFLIKDVDRNGNAITYSYTEGALTKMTDAHGRSLTFTYDSAGHVATVTDHGSRTWKYAYNENGELISVTDPAGGVRQYTYKTYQPLASGAQYSHLTGITDASGTVVTAVQYTADGKVASYSEGENLFTYSVASNYINKTDAMNNQWRYWLDENGLKIQVRDPVGNNRHYQYTDQGSVAKFTDEAGTVLDYVYDEYDRLTSVTTPDGTTTYTYEGATAFPISITSPTGRTRQFVYDNRFNLIKITDAANEATLLSYNESGDLIAVTDATGQKTEISYSATGLPVSVKDPLGREVKITYDALGNRTDVINPEGESNSYSYDLLNRLTSVSDGLERITQFAYDQAGRVLAVVAANEESVTYEYDEFGRLITRTDFDGVAEAVVYREDNLPASSTDRADVVTSFTYDRNGQITRATVGSLVTNYTYDARGLLTRAQNETGTVIMAYDAMGRMTGENNVGRVDYAYNKEGELVSQTSLGRTETFDYDPRGLLKRLTTPEGVFTFVYDALGRRKQLTYPSNDSIDYDYDLAGQLIQQVFAGAFSATFDYSFDKSGRLTSWTGDSAPRSYTYDAASQVKDVMDHLGGYSFAFDTVGNITSDGGNFDAANRLLENNTHAFTYDDAGNMLSKTDKQTGARITFTWNARNQLLRLDQFDNADATTPASTTTYTYGPLGRRWSRTRDGVVERFVYAGQDLIAALDSRNAPLARYSFGPGIDQPLVQIAGVSASYYFADYLGSVQALSDGTSLTEYDYSAYGMPTVSGAERSNPFMYTGREYEGDGIYYYRNRYYDAEIGQFIQSDPIGLDGGVNTYAYVEGNPIRYSDPFGLKGGKYGLCGLIALADGPEPFVADVVALGCICVVAMTASTAANGVAKNCQENPEQCPIMEMSKGGKQNIDNEYVRDVQSSKPDDPCKYLRELYSAEKDTRERQKIKQAMKRFNCDNKNRFN